MVASQEECVPGASNVMVLRERSTAESMKKLFLFFAAEHSLAAGVSSLAANRGKEFVVRTRVASIPQLVLIARLAYGDDISDQCVGSRDVTPVAYVKTNRYGLFTHRIASSGLTSRMSRALQRSEARRLHSFVRRRDATFYGIDCSLSKASHICARIEEG